MTPVSRPGQRRLLDRPQAPRVVITATTLLLVLVPLAPEKVDPWYVAEVVGALVFCAWIWTPSRWRRGLGLALALGLLTAAAMNPTPGADMLTIVGLTTAVGCVGLRWGLVLVTGLTLAGAAHVDSVGPVPLDATGAQSLLVVFFLVLLDRTSGAIRALELATHELAEPVDQERVRLSDRLGSLVGRTLAAAREEVRGAVEVADPEEPEVLDQLRDIEDLLDDGLEQLRLLVVEPVAGSLGSELEATRDVCGRLGITLTVSADDVPDRAVADTAATILREAVTNMLKHAEATRCVIAVRAEPDATVLVVTNDGANPVAEPFGSGGTGQRRWREALLGSEDELTTTALPGGRYQVHVRLPHGAVRARA